jgi:phospholipid-binding lipoprotein MlaA
MKRDWGLGVFLGAILWIATTAVPAAAGTAESGAGGGDRALIVGASSSKACPVGETCTLDGKARFDSSRLGSTRLAAFYSEYENRRADTGYVVAAAPAGSEVTGDPEEAEEIEAGPNSINDPLEPVNRAFFQFNDKLYFWFLKPAARGYRAVVPETARVGVRNFFYNLTGPVRLVNCVLQGKTEEAGYEFVRLFVNTTIGLGGFLDVAGDEKMQLERYDEDLGQTLGVYGMGPGLYIHWPFLGPSSGRDTLGTVGDGFLNPLNYLVPEGGYNAAIRTYEQVNETSLSMGEYEDLKRSALDPYVAIRDAYYQYRQNSIQE